MVLVNLASDKLKEKDLFLRDFFEELHHVIRGKINQIYGKIDVKKIEISL